MCDKYNLITSDLYMNSIDEYLGWVVKHKFFKKDHQRDFEGRLMGKQDELEKKRQWSKYFDSKGYKYTLKWINSDAYKKHKSTRK